ncbi:16S rRNA (guanine(966)-N(2))-methyltransferase RsmD [Halomonas urumqiensis]|uniref:Ribosomal RNA small subunit methyltransferase D n=1 Tax=Halomonas urumqiensis TaxID=1684789 RepID=A0A2N7UIT9_9GAMM|nr:16S rRNA (guanine(966)-N(2))-methyltransferase RsmD [Halomonas urumqiensis]PMR80358.1 16S rRNA (guanine(966)-N(2))-methyltransferase RsmD [Halomonas urumqiensis]PTB01537.1 16S rRNA (guanine(966)-N(2))-methyltransferase RsmD [Halomonas urumqiensis]GHE22378.1 ribosomal RNA small subunit methyltransferase D [Halomonas urumqiensis]
MTRRSPRPRRHGKPATPRRNGKDGGRLRIIGGDYRRRLLPVLDCPGLRPTPDRVRETLFNWLAAALPGAHVLDLFAGTGALGLEALSRGARDACFVERDSRVARQLADNLATLGVGERGQVATQEASTFLTGQPRPFHLVFLDPPFRQGLAAACCQKLEAGWLCDRAFIYLEVEAELAPEVPANWTLHREVRAGDSYGRLYARHSV